MITKHPATSKAALDKLEAAWREIPRECGGLSYAFAADLVPLASAPLNHGEASPLTAAIRNQWPDAKPGYWRLVERRWRELYERLPMDDATYAVSRGFSSPSAAMKAGIIRARKYIGYRESRS